MRQEYTLEDLLGSPAKIKIIKFFIRNSEGKYAATEISKFLREKSPKVRSALNALLRTKFLIAKKQSSTTFYVVNKNFHLFRELQIIVLKANPTSFYSMKKTLQKIKGVKLAVVSGILLGEDSSRADLLIVGDRLSTSKIQRLSERIESEVGHEITLVILDVKEFDYRRNMYDKFIRDILEYRHEKLINKLRLD